MSKKDVLAQLTAYYDHTVNSSQYQNWRRMMSQAWQFYDGQQWTGEEQAELEKRSQPVITVNMLAPKIDSVTGFEIQGRTQIAFKERDFRPETALIARGFTALAQAYQEISDAGQAYSLAFKEGLIGGIGWVNIKKTDESVDIKYRDAKYIGWDIDDETPQFTNSAYVFEHSWVDIDELKNAYPDKKAEITKLIGSVGEEPAFSTEAASEDYRADIGDVSAFYDEKRNSLRVIDLQYRKPATKYRYFDQNGRQKETFSLTDAEESAADKKMITEIPSFQIWNGVFTRGVLLYNAPLEVQTGHFELIPYVYKRRKQDGAPYGVVYSGIDSQRELNKRRSKMMHLLNTRGVIADSNAFDNPAAIVAQLARPDFVITKRPGTQIELVQNKELADSQFRIMQQAAAEIQQVTGIYDEFQGVETNATSGRAIGLRQSASQRNQAFAFDQLSLLKKRVGRLLLALIRNMSETDLAVQIYDEATGQKSQMILNRAYEIDGKTVYENDLTTANVEVFVEETPNYDAPPQEVAETLKQIIGNGQLNALANPFIAKQLGVRYPEEIAKGLNTQQPNSGSEQQQLPTDSAPKPVA
jgi:hypothetical protein